MFEKIIEKLEERKQLHNRMIDYENKNGTVSEEFQQRKAVEVLEYAIKIVNQVAAEYNNVMIDGKYCFQICACTEKCDKCIRLCNGDTDWYENIDNWTEEFGTDTNVGSNVWIPCSERLPKTNESVLCWAKSTARGGDVCFVGSCHNGFWFLQSSADTHSFPGQYVVVAWHPLPEPYNPNTCQDTNCPYNDGNECPAADGCAGYERKQTNADRIRSMSDEELLDFICSIETYDDGSVKTIEGGSALCSVTDVENWLQSEVE